MNTVKKDGVTAQAKTAKKETPIKEVSKLSILEQRELDFEVKDRVYRLSGAYKVSPWLKLQCSDNPGSRESADRLLYFDEEKKHQRSLKYGINQKSVFSDEQIGEVTQESVIFEKGYLLVPKENRSLQLLLSIYHPWNAENPGGKSVFYEQKPGAEAKMVVDSIKEEVDALVIALDLNLEEVEAILRPVHGDGVTVMKSDELRREILIFVKEDPTAFMNAYENDDLLLINTAYRSIDRQICELADSRRTYKFKKSGKIIAKLPYGEDPYESIALFFKTDEGIEVKSIIDTAINK